MSVPALIGAVLIVAFVLCVWQISRILKRPDPRDRSEFGSGVDINRDVQLKFLFVGATVLAVLTVWLLHDWFGHPMPESFGLMR
jgi:hypothetical protein